MKFSIASTIAAALLSLNCVCAQAATYVEETGLAITIEVADNGNATVTEEVTEQTLAMNP